MTKGIRAKELFSSGCNCSQSVFMALSKDTEISEEIAKKIASGFGGGVKNAEVCGAVSGAVMAIGLHFGDNKALAEEKTIEFTKIFKEEFNELRCKKLLGFDKTNPKEYKEAMDNGFSYDRCYVFVEKAANIADSVIKGK